jgi:hypothetical protein
MIGIPLGLLYANASEWLIHKYVLHGLGVNKDSTFAFHWHRHHKNSRRGDQHDPDFEVPWYREWQEGEAHGRSKEIVGLTAIALAHLPLAPLAPFFAATVVYSTINYYRVHKKSHQDVEWARKYLPWHVDHHIGPNQHANWCVTRPWFDQIMGTREPYVGTEKERADRARRQRNRDRKRQRELARNQRAAAAASAC